MPNQTVVVQKPPQVSASASIPIVKSTTNTFPKQGLAGPKGDRGVILDRKVQNTKEMIYLILH